MKTTKTITVDTEIWEKFDQKCGRREMSATVQKLIELYLQNPKMVK